jgi:hypothetical protein
MTSTHAGPWPANPALKSIRTTHRFIAICGVVAVGSVIAICLRPRSFGQGWTIFWSMAFSFAFVLVFVGFVTVSTYRKLAARIDQMFAGHQLIARWSCTPEEWLRHITREAKLLAGGAKWIKIMFGLIAIFCVGLIVILVITSKRPVAISSIATMLGILVAPWIVIYYFFGVFPKTIRMRTLTKAIDRDVYIGPGGVIIGGTFWSWEIYGARLTLAHSEPGDPGMITFRWGQPTGTVQQMQQEARVPVPAALNGEALRVVEVFKGMFKH